MPQRSQALAKLTRPRLHGAVPRERLLRLLDTAREHPIVWVWGPPGSGKTTLVASYVEQCKAPAIWYHLDAGDSDPATFFYYLVRAIVAVSNHAKPLPLLTQEYLADLEGFGRRFFRDAFAQLPEGCVLVLDNYQEVAAASSLHLALNAAFAEVPASANVVAISRAQPPAAFARLRIAGALTILGWEELRLSEEETAAIVATRRKADAAAVASIHASACGWVAGVRLLLEQTGTTANLPAFDRPELLGTAFEYFASEIFDRADADLRHVLLRTAFLQRFTAEMACSISGNPGSGRRIEELYKHRLFVDRRMGEEVTYQYHDLFREFLRNRAQRSFPASELASLAAESAQLLVSQNLVDEAYDLFVQGSDWEGAERIFIARAPALLAHGRWQTLERWSDMLPEQRRNANAWLLFWLGRSKALTNPGKALPPLEQAFESFVAGGDDSGQLLSAAAMVETLHFDLEHFDAMGAWLERLERLADARVEALSPENQLRVYSTLFWGAEHFAPGNPVIAPSVKRAERLLSECADVNLRVSVANMLHYHAGRTVNAQASRIAAQEVIPVLDSPELSADRLALYYLAEGYSHHQFGRYGEAFECLDRADAIIERHGLVGRAFVAGIWRGSCQVSSGDLAGARASLQRAGKLNAKPIPLITEMLQASNAWLAMALEETGDALQCVDAALESCKTRGPPGNMGFRLPQKSYILIAAGRYPEAEALLAELQARPKLVSHLRSTAAVALLHAWLAHKIGDIARRDGALGKSLDLAGDPRERVRMRQYGHALADLLPVALDQDHHVEAANALIHEAGIACPSPARERWPWPLRIYALGRFEVRIDDRPLEFGRKAPKRTIALLKAIIAFGGRDVPEERLVDALWPDQDGDLGHEALGAALHRLRRLLGGNEVIRQSHGTLSLDDRRCFVDTWAFESGVRQSPVEPAALSLYRGDFLPADVGESWSASLRERLRGRFVSAIQSTAGGLEAAGRFEEAVAFYSSGLDVDDLVEPFYQGLIRSFHRLGRTAEAATAYERLQRVLSGTLGVKPSAESERLFREACR